jgi:hypothetical protein
VDMPALLPDGTPSDLSVSPIIARRSLGERDVPQRPAEQQPGQIDAPSREEARP